MTSTNFKKVRLFKLVRELNVSLETLKEHLEQNGYADALTGSGINAAIQDEAAYNELVSAFADNIETAGRVHKKRARQTVSETTPVPPAEPAPEAAVATGDETEPLPKTILKIGVGHLFATGNRPDRDEIFHIAGMWYSGDGPPESRDWILKLNPNRKLKDSLTNRLWKQSRIPRVLRERDGSWKEAEPDIASFFADLDVLFVYDREKQKEWFERIVFKGKPRDERPVIVDLFEMTRFFLPDRNLPGDEALIQEFIPETEWRTNNPRLPLLVRSLGGVAQDIVSVIRSESQTRPGYHLVYTLLGRALDAEKAVAQQDAFPDFEALFRVASIAHRIHWRTANLFDEPYGRYGNTAPQMIRDTDFPKEPDVEDDARKRENWLIRQWTRLLSEEAAQSLEPVSPPKKIDLKNPPRVARPVVDPRRVGDSFNWLIEKANFKFRQEQKDFADFCVEAINRGGSYAIEAGTGTGKTLGYLIPACEYIRQGQAMAAEDTEQVEVGKIIIATATKNLQDQLLGKEGWSLAQRIPPYQDFTAAALKGQNNFLCITAVADLFGEMYRPQEKQKILENISPNDQARKRLAWLFLFLVLIRNRGETEGIPWNFFRERFPDLQDFHEEAKADVACAPGLCRMGTSCIYPRHLQKAQGADIVVTNHYKLPWLDSQIQALGHTCLIDEANQFPDNLRKAASVRLSRYEIHRLFLQRIKGSEKRRGFAEILEDRFTKKLQKEQQSEKPNEDTKKNLETAMEYIRSILASCEVIEHCSNTIENILKNSEKFKNYNSSKKRWIDCLGPVDTEHLQENISSLAEHFKNISERWDDLSQNKTYENIENVQQKQEKNRILKYIHYTDKFTEKTNEVKNNYPSNKYIHVCFFSYNKSGYGTWTLEKIPYDISKIVTETCCEPYATTIFTSATLFVDNSLNFFSDELGISFSKDAQKKRIASPFKYEEKECEKGTENKKVQVKGFVTTSISPYQHDFDEKQRNRWREDVAGAIARLAVAMYGRTLVLFTSTEEMKYIFERIESVLEQYGIDPLLQDGSSLAEITTFAATEESVLFGVERFWTGVDFPDRTLSQVIVVRLPNPNPSDPIMVHRKEVMGQAFWDDYYVPASKLRLRQGFGRLIRKETDKGLFMVLDQRIWSKYRMRDRQSALPVKLHCRSTEPDQMNWFIDEGLTHLDLKAEFERRNIDLRTITVSGETRPTPSGRKQPAELKWRKNTERRNSPRPTKRNPPP